MFNHILVVCTGNICRSPVAAAMLRRHLPDKTVECAGLEALEGHAADRIAKALAAEDQLDLSAHKGRRVNAAMVQSADLILVMTEGQRQALGERYPEALGKIMRFGQWLTDKDGRQGMDIPDPYGKSREAFSFVHQLLARAAEAWREKLT